MLCTHSAGACLSQSLGYNSFVFRRKYFIYNRFPIKRARRAHAAHAVRAHDGNSAASCSNSITRRVALSYGVASFVGSAIADELALPDHADQKKQAFPSSAVDYSRSGPFQPVRLPRLEHICSECFPRCLGDRCLLRIDATYPKGARNTGFGGPYPLAIFTSGYLVGCDAYQSYADKLASWGYTVVLYDKIESVADTLNDEVSARMITDILDWCEVNRLMRQIADTRRVYLVGHSRGGKISSLAAVSDNRVAALCLIDPVDTTVYAPLAPGFPSAVSALQRLPQERSLPIAVVGSGVAGDCVPKYSNYTKFFESVRSPSWEVLIQESGHFSFLDHQSALQRAICPQGNVSESDVRNVSQTVMVAWAEAMVRAAGAGADSSCGNCNTQDQAPEVPSTTTSTNATDTTRSASANSSSKPVIGTTTNAYVLHGEESSNKAAHTGRQQEMAISIPGTKSTAAGPLGSSFVGNARGMQGSGGYRRQLGATEGGQSQNSGHSGGTGCLDIQIDRRPLARNQDDDDDAAPESSSKNGSSTQLDEVSHRSAYGGSSFRDGVGGIDTGRTLRSGAKVGSPAVSDEKTDRQRGVSASDSVPKVNNLSDWSDVGVNEMREVTLELDTLFTNEAASTRKTLEGILTRLQYQTLLTLSSRFRNFEA